MARIFKSRLQFIIGDLYKSNFSPIEWNPSHNAVDYTAGRNDGLKYRCLLTEDKDVQS